MLGICGYLAPDDPAGLLNETLLYMLERDCSGIRNHFTYTYVALKTQAYSPNSRFNRKVRGRRTDLPLLDAVVGKPDEEPDTVDEDEHARILSTVERMEHEGKVTWYESKLFRLFYAYETVKDIKGLSLKETGQRRRMSFRRLEAELHINAKSIWNTTNRVLEKLKAELEKNNEHGRDEKPVHGQGLHEEARLRQAHGEA